MITPAQLGAYQSSCLLPTTYTGANEMAPEETVVVSLGITDEMIVNARGLRSEQMQGQPRVFLDWDATVLMMGTWNNDQHEGLVWEHGMLPIPDPGRAQQELCKG